MQNQTLYSTIIYLTAQQNGHVPATQGRLAHGAFLEIVQQTDPALSQVLHDMNTRKPFTVSPLRRVGKPKRGKIAIKAGQAVWLRVTLLNESLFTSLTQYMLSTSYHWPNIRLAEITFMITEMRTTPRSHPWAGYVTTYHLQQTVTGPDWTDANEITLEFTSPTAFSMGRPASLGRWIELFPTPKILFTSLAQVWQNQLPHGITPDQVREYAEQTVAISKYNMATQVHRYWGNPQKGTTGQVTYELRDKKNPLLRQTIHLLSELAFYSGVGYKTTMGMGQVRRLPRRETR